MSHRKVESLCSWALASLLSDFAIRAIWQKLLEDVAWLRVGRNLACQHHATELEPRNRSCFFHAVWLSPGPIPAPNLSRFTPLFGCAFSSCQESFHDANLAVG
jgi:hypothetical protein